MTKLEKLEADLKKARAKQDALNEKIKAMEAKHKQEESQAIYSLVTAAHLTPQQLAEVLKSAKKGRFGLYPEMSAADQRDKTAAAEKTEEPEETEETEDIDDIENTEDIEDTEDTEDTEEKDQ